MSNCQYCNGTKKIETDNNGPIVDCPLCVPTEWGIADQCLKKFNKAFKANISERKKSQQSND